MWVMKGEWTMTKEEGVYQKDVGIALVALSVRYNRVGIRRS